LLVSISLIIFGAVPLLFLRFSKKKLLRLILFIVILISGIVFTWHIEISEEKIHIIEYAFLGWLASKDMLVKSKKIHQIVFPLIFISVVGIADEVFQILLPYRFFGWRDIMFNHLGGIWGIMLFHLY